LADLRFAKRPDTTGTNRALGGLLRKSGDTDYAKQTIEAYQQQSRRDA